MFILTYAFYLLLCDIFTENTAAHYGICLHSDSAELRADFTLIFVYAISIR